MTRHLTKGDKLVDPMTSDVQMVVMGSSLMNERLKVFDFSTNGERYVDYDELRRDIAEGRLKLHIEGFPLIPLSRHDDPELDNALIQAQACTRLIKDVMSAKQISAHRAIRTVTLDTSWSTTCELTHMPSRSTLYRCLERERQGLPLLRGNKNKGNRQPRYSEAVINLICETATRLQQEKSRWTVRDVTKYVNRLAKDRHLIGPDQTISRAYVSKVVFNYLTTDLDRDRMDRRTVAAAKSIARQSIRVAYPFQRVEMDALHLPWHVTTEFGVAKDLYLVHAIECSQSMPVGWCLVIGTPTASDALRCVESILYSKQDKFAALGLNCDIDPFGMPATLVMDNGPENKGDRIIKLARLGIDPVYCRSNHPQEKPFIERLNRSLKEALQTLPGCTRFDDEDGQRDPEKLQDLPMPIEELERWIVRWYYEKWVNTDLARHVRSIFIDDRGLGATPKIRWQKMIGQGYALPLPPSRVEWLEIRFVHETGTLSRTTGITYATFSFRGPNLQYLIDKFGENPVTFLVDPDDFRRIYVLDGDDHVELINKDVDECTPAYSFTQAKEMHAKARAEAKADKAGQTQREGFQRDLYNRSSEVSAKASGKSKKKAEAKETVQRSKQRQAAERARDNPISSPVVPPTTGIAGVQFSLDDVPALPVVDRKSGKERT